MSRVVLGVARFVVAIPFAFLFAFSFFYLGRFSDFAFLLSVLLFCGVIWGFVKLTSLTDGDTIEGVMIYQGPSDGGHLFVYQGLTLHLVNHEDLVRKKSEREMRNIARILRSIPCNTQIWVRAWKFQGRINIITLGTVRYSGE